MNNKCLYIALVGELQTEEPFVQTFWSYADDIGEAIEKITSIARTCNIVNPIIQEIDPYDIDNLESGVEYNQNKDVFWNNTRYIFPAEDSFELPTGVISSCIEGDHHIEEIVKGVTTYTSDGIINIEVNVEQNKLLNLYNSIIIQFKKIRVFWYVIHGYWGDSSEDVIYVNEELKTPQLIMNHIKSNIINSLENGYLSLTSFLKEGSTNITISDHKRIIITTRSQQISDKIISLLDQLDYPVLDELVSIDQGIHHWHYKKHNALNKRNLICHLTANGFNIWNPNK